MDKTPINFTLDADGRLTYQGVESDEIIIVLTAHSRRLAELQQQRFVRLTYTVAACLWLIVLAGAIAQANKPQVMYGHAEVRR